MQLSPIFARPAASSALRPPATRLAGGAPKVSNIFSNIKRAGSHLVGPALTGGFAAYEISQGKDPKQVAIETGVYEGASALGAGIGGVLGGPPGAIAGGIIAPVAVGALDILPNKLADISGFSVEELREIAGRPRVGGLTTPAPYEAPPVPDVTSNIFGNIDFTTVKATPVVAETGADQPIRSRPSPAAQRPVEESHTPLSRTMPATANPPTREETRQAVEDELIARAAQQKRTDDLTRQLIEAGATKGMTDENARKWVASNTELAEQVLADRLGREQRLAKEFEGFSAYA